LNADIREAYRNRDVQAKQIGISKTSGWPKKNQLKVIDEIKKTSHLVIQLDHTVFLDLANIDNLTSANLSKNVQADYNCVANKILSMSPYYKGAAANSRPEFP